MDEKKLDENMNMGEPAPEQVQPTVENPVQSAQGMNTAELQWHCSKCSAIVPGVHSFCPNCGTAREAVKVPLVCKKCGTLLYEGQKFCPSCGKKCKKKSKKKTVLFIIIALVVIGLIAIFSNMSGSVKDLNSVYNSVVDGTSIYVDISSDGKSITVDTNPYDYDDYYSSEAVGYVKAINNALDLPNSVYEKMGETSALDGRLSEEYGNIRVSWKYHPDKGLQVIYEIID